LVAFSSAVGRVPKRLDALMVAVEKYYPRIMEPVISHLEHIESFKLMTKFAIKKPFLMKLTLNYGCLSFL
jgi:hypothetical protein